MITSPRIAALWMMVCSMILATSAPAFDAAAGATVPVVSRGPDSQTVAFGATVVFSVDSDDDFLGDKEHGSSLPGVDEHPATDRPGANVKFQWLKNRVQLKEESDAVLVLKNASSADAGTY